ncbi:MAG: hypothetical protein IAE96_04890 [Chitinophagaceae bacterium]|nr:hypothetical protein [Chitinophagaceae bacterium]
MEAIRIWLNGKQDYLAGVRLFSIYGKDLALKRSFAEPLVTDYKKKRLREVLEQLISTVTASSVDIPAKPVIKTPGHVTSFSASKSPISSNESIPDFTPEKGWSDKRDPTEQALHINWKPLFLELMNLTARVGDIARAGKMDPLKKIEAGRMALRILDLDDQLDHIYRERDMYRKTGQLPDKRPYGEPCIDFKQMPVKLANHQRYVRDYKAKLAKQPGNTDLAHQLQKHEWFVAHYKKELNIV